MGHHYIGNLLENFWKIASDVKSETNITVFGWDYSDEDCIWPNITKLTVKGIKNISKWPLISSLDYPDKISLLTTDLQPHEIDFLGVFYKADGQASGRPAWKQPNRDVYIIYNGRYFYR